MTRLHRNRRDWDDLAKLDPYWAILAEPDKRFGRWDHGEFLRSGAGEIADLIKEAGELGLPRAREASLDFGCGLGRLTRALAAHFRVSWGADISPRMIERARDLHRDVPNCQFQTTDGALTFPDDRFDLIYSVLVLQHVPSRAGIRNTVRELVRTLKPGGLLCFQLPSRLPLRRRWQLRRRLYGVLRAAGIGERLLYERYGLYPIRMNALPEGDIRAVVGARGGRVLAVRADQHAAPEMESRLYFVTKDDVGSAAPGPHGSAQAVSVERGRT